MCKKVVIVSTSTSRTSRKKGGRTGCWPVTCTTIHHPSSGGPRIGCALSAWDVMEGLSWLFLSREVRRMDSDPRHRLPRGLRIAEHADGVTYFSTNWQRRT